MSFIKKIQEVVWGIQTGHEEGRPSCTAIKTANFKVSDSPRALRPLTFEEMDVRYGWVLFAPGALGVTLARGTAVAAEAATIGAATAGSSFLAKWGVFGAGVATGAGVAMATRSSGTEPSAEASFLKRLQAAAEEWVTPTGGPLLPLASPGLVPLPSTGFPTGPILEPRTANIPGRPALAPDRFAPGPKGDPSTSPAAPLPRHNAPDMTDLPPIMTPVASAEDDGAEVPASGADSGSDPSVAASNDDGVDPKPADANRDKATAVVAANSGTILPPVEEKAKPRVNVGKLLSEGEPVGLVLPKGGSIVVDPSGLGYKGPFEPQGYTEAPPPSLTGNSDLVSNGPPDKSNDDPKAMVVVLLKLAASARKTHPDSDVFEVITWELEKLGRHGEAQIVRAMGRAPYKSRADELVARLCGEFSSLFPTDVEGREIEALLAALLATLLQLNEYHGTEEAKKGLRDTAVAFTSQFRNLNSALLGELQRYKGPIFEMKAIVPLLNEIASVPPPDVGHGLLHAAAESIKKGDYSRAERLLEAAYTVFRSRHNTAGMAEAADMLEGLNIRLRSMSDIDGSILLGMRGDGEPITLRDRHEAAERIQGMDDRAAVELGLQMFRDLAHQRDSKKEDIILLKAFLAAMSCLMPSELVTLLGKVESDASLMKQLAERKNTTLRWAGDLVAWRYIFAEMKQAQHSPDAMVPAAVTALHHLTAFITWTRGLIEEDRVPNPHLTKIRERSIADAEQRIYMILRLLHFQNRGLTETPLDQVYDVVAKNQNTSGIVWPFIVELRVRDAMHRLKALGLNVADWLTQIGKEGVARILGDAAQSTMGIAWTLTKYNPAEIETWMARGAVSPKGIYLTAFLRRAVLALREVPGFERPGLISALIRVCTTLSPLVEIYKHMESARLTDRSIPYHLSDEEMKTKEAVEIALGEVLKDLKQHDPSDIDPLPVLFEGSDVETLVSDLVRNPDAFVEQDKGESGQKAKSPLRLVPPPPETPQVPDTPEGTP